MLVAMLSVDNLLTIKAVLKSLELALSLKVNFSKSILFTVTVGRTFLDLAADFLHCKVDLLLFKYLRLSVGENPKKKGIYDLLVNLVSQRLSS